MLQVPQTMQLQPRAASAPANDQVKMTDEEWFSREYHLIAHIKGGWEFSAFTAHAMKASITGPNGEEPKIHASSGRLGHVMSEDNVMLEELVNEPACFEHMVRNPFEMLVSGYMYNSAGSEYWAKMTFAQVIASANASCDPLLVDCGIAASKVCQDELKSGQWKTGGLSLLRSITQLYECSRKGPMSSLLPDAKLTESFMEYLQRVDIDKALIAQFIFASDSSMYPMLFQHDYFKARECSTELCLSDMYVDCRQQWIDVFKVWEVPDTYHDDLLKAASTECPNTSEHAEGHSSDSKAQNQGLEHEPYPAMVVQLRHLDQQHLNGTIADIEAKVDCALSSKYAVTVTAK
jgi:hypothetical protein